MTPRTAARCRRLLDCHLGKRGDVCIPRKNVIELFRWSNRLKRWPRGPDVYHGKKEIYRHTIHTRITITAAETIYVSNKLRDISLGGAYIAIEAPLPEATTCTLDIDLIGPASLLRIQVEGEVVRAQEDGVAVKFTRIDLDSLLHLKTHDQGVYARS